MMDYFRIRKAAESIKQGHVVAFPTETVYGLGADAFNSKAVGRIFELKGRPASIPLIVHIASSESLEMVAQSIPRKAKKLADKFWPGPLTLILPKRSEIPAVVTAGLPGVGVRIPNHPIALKLIEFSESPIAAPSANKYGRTSPTSVEAVQEQFGADTVEILDGGTCHVGIESTIISFVNEPPLLLRHGGVPLELIEQEIGCIELSHPDSRLTVSPGRSIRHYAPLTPLTFTTTWHTPPAHLLTGLLTFMPAKEMIKYDVVEILSQEGNLDEAASELFAALRRLDSAGLDHIIAMPVPNRGIGRAINDRLARASAMHQHTNILTERKFHDPQRAYPCEYRPLP